MRPRVILHIGTHRTGTTSLQAFLRGNPALLDKAGYVYPAGRFVPNAHGELHLAAMRDGRDSPVHDSVRSPSRAALAREVAASIRAVRAANPGKVPIFSTEGLSYVRYPDEVQALRALFGEADVRIVLYLRERASFLKSYRRFLAAHDIAPSQDRASYRYVEPDTWLLDYDALVRAYAGVFGMASMTILAYEAEQARHGGTVRSFFRALGYDIELTEEPRARLDERAGGDASGAARAG
jgi:hypothetical protein